MVKSLVAFIRNTLTPSTASFESRDQPKPRDGSRRTRKRAIEEIQTGPGMLRVSGPKGFDPTPYYERSTLSALFAIKDDQMAQAREDADLLASEEDDEQPPPADGSRERTLEREVWFIERKSTTRAEYEHQCAMVGVAPRPDWTPKRDRRIALAEKRERESRATYHAGSSVFDRIGRWFSS